MNNEKYFTWRNAWVIAAILWSIEDNAEIDLATIIGAGDMLNHAIFTKGELTRGLYKAQKKGIIAISHDRIKILPSGKELKEKVQKMKGGVFSIVDNIKNELNSVRFKLDEIEESAVNPCLFINDSAIKQGYENYCNRLKRRQ